MVDLSAPAYLRRNTPEESEEWSDNPQPFRRRKNEVDAIRINEANAKVVAKWCGGEAFRVTSNKYVENQTDPLLRVPTLEGPLSVYSGEWLVKDEDGRYSVMDNKSFVTEYEYDKAKTTSSLPQSSIPGARSSEA